MSTRLETKIKLFVIHLTSPCSTAPSSADSGTSGVQSSFNAFPSDSFSSTAPSRILSDSKEANILSATTAPSKSISENGIFDFWFDTDGDNLLNSPPLLILFETLVLGIQSKRLSPALRAAILYYLLFHPSFSVISQLSSPRFSTMSKS